MINGEFKFDFLFKILKIKVLNSFKKITAFCLLQTAYYLEVSKCSLLTPITPSVAPSTFSTPARM
jgi:hypothetical protein